MLNAARGMTKSRLSATDDPARWTGGHFTLNFSHKSASGTVRSVLPARQTPVLSVWMTATIRSPCITFHAAENEIAFCARQLQGSQASTVAFTTLQRAASGNAVSILAALAAGCLKTYSSLFSWQKRRLTVLHRDSARRSKRSFCNG